MSYYYHFTPDERNEIVEKLFAYLLKCTNMNTGEMHITSGWLDDED